MKKYKYILAIILGVITINSCDESGLEQINKNNIAPETFFSTSSQVQASVNAIYANLQTRGLYARHMFFMMDNMAHENGGNNQLEADKRQYLDFSFTSAHGAIAAYWNSCYKGINKANFVIGNQDKINELPDGVLNQTNKAKFIGEAKFLRGLYYFFLVTRYGDVPLITSIPEDGVGSPRSPKADVYQQIVTDLKDASNTLLSKSSEENGRATKEAAIALLGKVQLFRGEHRLALDEFEKIYGDYQLENNFYDNFKEETEHGVESIFEVVYDDDLGNSAVWNSDSSGEGLNEVTFRGQEYGFNDWFNVFPSDDLLNEFETGDTRFSDTFYVNGDTFGANNEFTVNAFPSNGGGNAGWKKYQNYYKDEHEDMASGINCKVIRYADVLLMMAECENEVGTQAKAIDYINEVRERPSVSLTPLATTLTKPQVFDAIVHERKVELAGEQCRFNDLIRWGLAGTVLNGTGFQSGKHEVFPIPLSEISSNENITPADQNTGY
ncbi:RagB/SusD family nutrient uptake outer membrane protein [Thalassobellus citreus]|uniref:RagB/SusD family nutrient uptake outer membrane protein n=1 Tax=Thalassobellus citreus TaxID=3367752 RepID=UPI00378F6B1F